MRIRLLLGVVLLAFALPAASACFGDDINIDIHADRQIGKVSRLLTGACIEDVNHQIYGGIYSQMIFGESFQEPVPSPAIKGFTTRGGRWLVHDGIVTVTGGDGPKLVSQHAAFADGAVGVEIRFAGRAGQNAGLLLRVNKPGDGADKFNGYEVALDPARQTLRLARHRHNFEPIKDMPCEIAIGRWIPLEVRLAGSTIDIRVDGKSILKHDDGAAALAAGTVALRVWNREASYRNLWVKTGEQRESLPFIQTAAASEISGMWQAVQRGTAVANYATASDRPFIGTQSQQMTYESGEGEIGIENQGLNRWGMNFVAARHYQGYAWVRADTPTELTAALESQDGSQTYAEVMLHVSGKDWQRLDFALTPAAADKHGRFVLKLKHPGSVTIGHAFLQPGEWGRFKGLAVRRDVAQGLIDQGITVLRYGGSMVNSPAYKWKNMIGPRDRRPPYCGTWYRYSSNGWGIPDFLSFCEAAGFEGIPAFNLGETPQDLADFIEYAKAPANSDWGRRRALDGHPAPYPLRCIELGNEERVDEKYAEKFETLAAAIWAKDPKMILVVGDFAYGRPIDNPFNFKGAASGISTLAAHQRILHFARQHDGEVWFDVHLGTERPVADNASQVGMLSFTTALAKIADGAACKVVVFELNAGNHAQKRALANALAINAIERDGRIPIVCSANVLQPDKQNDNGWDQGLLFLNPGQVWLQPPGYVTQMYSTSYQPQLVQCDVSAAATGLDATATRSDDGKTLVLKVVNPGEKAIATEIRVSGFTATDPSADVTELYGALEAVNTADKPDAVVPRHSRWEHGMKDGRGSRLFAGHSVTVIRWRQ